MDAISTGVYYYIHDADADNWIAGKIKPSGMITKKIKLDRVVEDGFHTLIDDKDNQVKILVDLEAK